LPRDRTIRFGRYRFHSTQGLTRGKREVRVTAKALAVLRVLAGRPGQVVTKQDLFQEVWPDTAVSDTALTSCILELRRALQDDARRPQYIETLHRRGYRFIARPFAEGLDTAAAAAAGPVALVGRESPLAELSALLERALAGERQVVFVTGEPGIGKTALVQAFVAELASRGELHVTRGECVERYSAGEPYQPLLEAVTRLSRQPEGDRFVGALRQHAPTWLAQLPSLQTPAEQRALQRRAAGVTPERMLRELTDTLEVVTADTPIVLCLEDLHWSDPSTLDWIAAFARRGDPARLLLIGSYRPQETDEAQPVRAAIDDLRVRGRCREIALAGLDEPSVSRYVSDRFPAGPAEDASIAGLARRVYRHTEGNPLFVVNVLDDLVARGVLVAREGRWLVCSPGDEALGIPDGIRRTIERQIDRLDGGPRELLEVASVLGRAWPAASVAAGAQIAPADVEAALGTLARQGRLVREGPALEWPDGTRSAGFEFLHALYREVLSDRLSPARRDDLHRRIGLRLETAYGERAPEIADELAVHFEQARDAPRAILYLQRAAERDERRSAHGQALAHFRRALALLEGLPASLERDEHEIALRIGLGGVLMATRGYSGSEVEATFTRARELCERRPGTPLFTVLWGLWMFNLGSRPLAAAREVADRLSALAERSDDPGVSLQAHHAQWATAFSAGDLEGTESHARQGAALYDPERHGTLAAVYGGHDPGVCARLFGARVAALAGRTETAGRVSDEAIAMARELAHPFTLVQSLVFAAATHQARRDAATARERAAAAAAYAREHSFSLMLAWASAFEGWATVELGDRERGLRLIREGTAAARSTGSMVWQPMLVGLLAETQLKCGLRQEAWQSLDDAFALADRTGEQFHQAELHRLRGELHLLSSRGEEAQAEAELRTALEVARRQGAKQLALRASLSLARSWTGTGRHAEACALVTGARRDLAEGSDLPDLQEADAFLASERGGP
jgi:DNA-binding winged helix-turn-helix (wHTH) protein/predicted ATPase